jgi:small subunit ribosomal protein S18
MADRPKKRCYFLVNKITVVDYKDANLLKRFLTDRGKILPRRITGISSYYQRALTKAVKRARAAGVLAYTFDN